MKKNVLFVSLALLASSLMAQNTIDNAFFDKVNFRGAFGTTDWTSGWANYDPQNKVYPATTATIAAGNITTNTTLGSPLRGAASFADASLANPFFTPVDYIGAFGTTDWTAGWSNFDPQNKVYAATDVTIAAGNITTNTTWTKNHVYLLTGYVFVNDGVTLTIEPGTIIRGDKTSKATLIVSQGGKLIANGTVAEPIVFTSNQPVGSRAAGDWGGVILLGKAPINPIGGTATIEGGVGLSAIYGGTDAADNSGSLQYVRIEFPGVAYATDNEINGLTMGGVGSGTTIDNIEVIYSGDDSYEWFGGTVNCKHLIAIAGVDDDFDTDFGYSGMVQFAVGLRHPLIDDQSASGTSNGFESDNNAAGDAVSPYTSAVFCNVSEFGPLATATTTISNHFGRAMHIRRNSKLKVFNSVFAGWKTGLYIDGITTQANAVAGDLKIKNCVLAGMTVANFGVPASQTWDVAAETAWFNTAGFGNTTYTNNTDLLVANPFTLTSPDFTTSPSYLLSGYVFVNDGVTLTVKPGTIIRGDKTSKATLIVSQGGKLVANGTATEPVIFTSNQPVGSRAAGDWGGVILLGKAPINPVGGTATIEGGVGLSAVYGGTDAADNSGSLKYVRIEYPGVAYATDNEINGLTFGGVGSGTTIDNIQVSYSGDDSYEWFGGTVNCKHLVAIAGVDDDFDTDFGYSGMIQYAVGLRHPLIDDQSASGTSNGFESDNNAAGDAVSPYTSAILSNVSEFGPLATSTTTISNHFGRAMHIRRNSKLQVYNSVFAGWKTGLYIDGITTQANAVAGDLKVRNSVFAGMTVANFGVPASQTWDVAAETAWFSTAAFKNETFAANTDLNVVDPFTITAPKFVLNAGSTLNTKSYWNTLSAVADQKANASSLTVYPNPASDELIINLPFEKKSAVSIKIVDVTGREVYSKEAVSVEKENINVSNLSNGIYLVVAKQGDVKLTQKLLIRK
ncbi:MAG: T9SS type A sorting domain-containing protein [Paludibacter sp.]|nr:T9SS type A sorting domain-containing protein [Paludibacter sp.]